MFEAEKDSLELRIKELLIAKGLPYIQPNWSWIPFTGQWGLATSFFQVHAEESKNLNDVNIKESAAETARFVKTQLGHIDGFSHFEAVNGYLNCYFDKNLYSKRVIESILVAKENYGKNTLEIKKTMVEFSQPNTHKAFHVGHLRNMVLGDSVCRILTHAGNQVVRANYIGDIGLHVIKWLWNYSKCHANQVPPPDATTRWMGEIYTEAIKRLEENPELESEVRELFIRWDNNDPQIAALWERTRQWSLNAFCEVYDLLDIQFDKYYYESEVEDSGKEIVDQLVQSGVARDERPEGAIIVDLDKVLGTENQYRVLVILRSDGTSLYSTKDLALAIKKFKEYDLDRSIYVIDVRQSLYMKQIFKVLEIMGYPWSKNCYHLAYEIVNLPGNVTIASREGTIVLLEDLLNEAEKRARVIVEEKNPELSEELKKDVSQKVALGALKYSLLSRDNTKVITFDWESAMDVNGQAAPYIQYAYVRANSILKKVQNPIPDSLDLRYTLSENEIELIDQLARFPQEVEKAARELRPLMIANYSYGLARKFSNFYNTCPVLNAEQEIKDFRLMVVAASRQVIKNSLTLLGIQVPEVM